jgi:hypothetical protein
MKINDFKQFLSAFRTNPHVLVRVDVESNDSIADSPLPVQSLEIESELMNTLLALGIIYVYGGSYEVNPMAIRVLDIMHAEGKSLNPETFQNEIEESKKLHRGNNYYDSFEKENLFS